MLKAANEFGVSIVEFTVAPNIAQSDCQSYHEWFIEFENEPHDMNDFINQVDDNLRSKNVYYDDLIAGNILQKLVIRKVRKNGFIDYMKQIGKLGGQNKVARLTNDRKIAEVLQSFLA